MESGNRQAECGGQALHRKSLPRIGVLLGVRKWVCVTMAMAGGGCACVYRALRSQRFPNSTPFVVLTDTFTDKYKYNCKLGRDYFITLFEMIYFIYLLKNSIVLLCESLSTSSLYSHFLLFFLSQAWSASE